MSRSSSSPSVIEAESSTTCAIVMISAPHPAGLPGEGVDGQSPEELAGLLADALWFGCADASLRSYEAARPVGSSSTWVIGEREAHVRQRHFFACRRIRKQIRRGRRPEVVGKMASRGDDLRDLLWRLSHPKRLGPAVFVLLAALLLPRFLAPHSRMCHALRKLYDVPSEPLDPPEPWDSSILAVLGASSTSRPVLFTTTDTALGATPCVARWRDPAHLTRLGGESPLTAWRHNSSEFMLARGQEARFTRSRAITRVNLTLNEFFAAAGETQPLLYSVGPLSSTLGDALQHEAAGIQSALAVSDAPSDLADASSWPSSATNVWLGHGGVLATTHYDPSHNVVLQLAGAKTWLLWPPESISALRLHPATHPSRRQTRAPLVPAERPAGEEWGYEHAPALRVEMRAGDAIYVPPYWSHAVLATEASVSLSVISPSWIPAMCACHIPHPFSRPKP